MMRKKHDDMFKAKVALEASREGARINEIAAKYQVHPGQVTAWKKQLLQNVAGIFSAKENKEEKEWEKKEEEYLKALGQKDMDINFLKKNLKKLNLL
jgi:transposase-like protein